MKSTWKSLECEDEGCLMCGFAGVISTERVREFGLQQDLDSMIVTLRHRGPDDEGRWTSADGKVALAFRRLAIVDVTPTGHQPMISPSGRFVIAFNGEVYNYRELREELA